MIGVFSPIGIDMLFRPRKFCRTGRQQRWNAITIPVVVSHIWSNVSEIVLEYKDDDDLGYIIVHPVRGGTATNEAATKKQ